MKITKVDLESKTAGIRGAISRPLMDLCFSGDLEKLYEDRESVLSQMALNEVRSDFKSAPGYQEGDDLADVIARKFKINLFSKPTNLGVNFCGPEADAPDVGQKSKGMKR